MFNLIIELQKTTPTTTIGALPATPTSTPERKALWQKTTHRKPPIMDRAKPFTPVHKADNTTTTAITIRHIFPSSQALPTITEPVAKAAIKVVIDGRIVSFSTSYSKIQFLQSNKSPV